MDAAHPSGATPLTLTALERQAIRDEIALDATALADVGLAMRHGDRSSAQALLSLLDTQLHALDAIDWTGHDGGPTTMSAAPTSPTRLPQHEIDQNRARWTTALRVLRRAQEARR